MDTCLIGSKQQSSTSAKRSTNATCWQKCWQRGISPNFAEPGCSSKNTCPNATHSQQSSVTRQDITFPILTQTTLSSPKGEYQYRFAWLEHMKLNPEHSGANTTKLAGWRRSIDQIAHLSRSGSFLTLENPERAKVEK